MEEDWNSVKSAKNTWDLNEFAGVFGSKGFEFSGNIVASRRIAKKSL